MWPGGGREAVWTEMIHVGQVAAGRPAVISMGASQGQEPTWNQQTQWPRLIHLCSPDVQEGLWSRMALDGEVVYAGLLAAGKDHARLGIGTVSMERPWELAHLPLPKLGREMGDS